MLADVSVGAGTVSPGWQEQLVTELTSPFFVPDRAAVTRDSHRALCAPAGILPVDHCAQVNTGNGTSRHR